MARSCICPLCSLDLTANVNESSLNTDTLGIPRALKKSITAEKRGRSFLSFFFQTTSEMPMIQSVAMPLFKATQNVECSPRAWCFSVLHLRNTLKLRKRRPMQLQALISAELNSIAEERPWKIFLYFLYRIELQAHDQLFPFPLSSLMVLLSWPVP